jgi:hypothetical protein
MPGIFAQIADIGENAGGALGDLVADGGELHAPMAPLDQFDAELFLKLLDLGRQSGLGDGAIIRRQAEMPESGQRVEIAKLSHGWHGD